MDIDNDPDVLLVRKHLVEHLGRPNEVFEVRGSPLPNSPIQALHLAYFAPAGDKAPVIFATCGASLFAMKDGRRVEGLMLLKRAPDPESTNAIHRVLSSFAIFAEANNETVRIGDVVRAPENLHRFSNMDAVLFLPPVPFVESFHRAQIRNKQSVDIIWLLPVYEAEAEYALKHGPQALMILFAAQGLDLTEMRRDEANTMIQPEDARQIANKRSEEERRKGGGGGKAKSSSAPRRGTLNQGSFELQEDEASVTVVRRGVKAKGKVEPSVSPPKRHLEVVPPPPPEEPAESSGPSQQRQPLVAKPKRPPLGLAPVKAEKVVKFDLATGAEQNEAPGAAPTRRTGLRKPIAPQKPAKSATPKAAAPPQKPKAPETAEEKAEAKKKKIEALKQKAQEAARRAAERQAGGAPAAGDSPEDED